MKPCAVCKKAIESATPTVSVVGGLFPQEDPDFFMIDETVMPERYVHLECFLRATSQHSQESS